MNLKPTTVYIRAKKSNLSLVDHDAEWPFDAGYVKKKSAILLTEEQLLELKKQWMDEPVKMLEQFYSMVAPHIVGHKTASNLFFSAINKMKGEENGANKSFLNSIKL